MIYLGTPGRMVGIKCPVSQREESATRFSFQTTLEGRVKAQVLQGGMRVWDVGLGRTVAPEQLNALAQFANGSWGAGPFVFVPADAPVTNLLTPPVASCDPRSMSTSVSPDGPMSTPDGWAARSVQRVSDIGFFGSLVFTPVLPGVQVTGSAYVAGAEGRVRVYWYDQAGVNISHHTSAVRSTAGEVVRSHVTATPPVGAVSCRLAIVDGTQAAWPCLTWTDRLMPVSPGHGCDRAVVHGVSKDVVRATDSQQYYSTGFTVTEVG